MVMPANFPCGSSSLVLSKTSKGDLRSKRLPVTQDIAGDDTQQQVGEGLLGMLFSQAEARFLASGGSWQDREGLREKLGGVLLWIS